MGCGPSTLEDERSKEITLELKRERKKMAREIKLLLLGE